MKRVVVVGAGISGLLAVKSCVENGISDIVCYEKSDSFGGLWRFCENDDGLLIAPKSTLMITSKEATAFSDFPPDEELPVFMTRKRMMEYLSKYLRHFRLQQYIQYEKEVTAIIPNVVESEAKGAKQWTISVRDLRTKSEVTYFADVVVVCAGYHSKPNVPNLTGLETFTGQLIHSINYKSKEAFKSKKVLVIGSGNSALDIATDLCSVTECVRLSTRRGFWTLSRNGSKGFPWDMIYNKRCVQTAIKLMPGWLICRYFNARIARIDHEIFGFKPSYPLLAKMPTINDYLYSKIIGGQLTIYSEVERIAGNKVTFKEDNNDYEVDCIILATGYGVNHPFLMKTSESIVRDERSETNEEVNCYDRFQSHLYENMFCPHLNNPESLIMIGMVQSYAAHLPIVELQCRWAAALIVGTCDPLPAKEAMFANIERRKRKNLKRYAYTETYQIYSSVNWLSYCDRIAATINCKPNFYRMFFTQPKLFFNCYFGSFLPYQYRVDGPHRWNEAKRAILEANRRIVFAVNTRDGKKLTLSPNGCQN